MTSAPPRASSEAAGALPYRADLDGLRAVAVLLVILTHAYLPWTNNGGDAGVTAFFVLSGFLITSILMSERVRTGGVDLASFYRRRICRLGPALAGLLTFVVVIGLGLGLKSEWQLGIASCVVYVSNWVQVLGHQIDPLGHTWSLAIEEQFYVAWPLLLVVMSPRSLLGLSLVIIVVSTIVRIVTDGPFEYFSTVTRADAILMGCALALTSIRLPWWTSPIGLVALFGVAYLNLSHDVTIPVAMIAAAFVIAGQWRPLGSLAPIGIRAYSLYLWNSPMILVFGPVGVPMTFIAAELSYRLLERPLLRRRRQAESVRPLEMLLRSS